MGSATLIALLLLGVVSSVLAMNCFECSSIPGDAPSNACLRGNPSMSQSSGYPLCATFGEYDSNKVLVQMARTPYFEADSLPEANVDCYESTDLQGNKIYIISCTCGEADNCNDFIIDNCKCEKPARGFSNMINFSMLGAKEFYIPVVIGMLSVAMLLTALLIVRRRRMALRYQSNADPIYVSSTLTFDGTAFPSKMQEASYSDHKPLLS